MCMRIDIHIESYVCSEHKSTLLAKSKKYYVVWKGKVPGVYETWHECQKQIAGTPGAIYKSFKTEREATNAFLGDYRNYVGLEAAKKSMPKSSSGKYIYPSISVDAACSGNPGDMEYQGVDTKTKALLFRQGPFKQGTNNIGEFLALVHALALYHKSNPNLPIYTDSKTAQAWVRNKKVKTTLQKTKVNEPIFDLMERALQWLHTHTYTNPIVKWDTKDWGEIPADFGRK